MSKLQKIENALRSINDSVFQNLCDEVIYLTEPGYPDIQRSGSQRGKQKTIKGTPDSYYLLPNGLYVLIEYTTVVKGIVQKIKEDVNKTLDPKKTGISIDKIAKIIYCFNGVLSLAEREVLKEFGLNMGVILEIKTLDTLSMILNGRCTHVAKEYLGIPIDTGQILPPDKFIKEYGASGIATKLDNKFVPREAEITALANLVLNNRIVIVSGAPGVGKTRLVLELFSRWAIEEKKAALFVISDKTASIFEDLRIYFYDDKQYFILVDDANRQTPNLLSLLAILKEDGRQGIHVVITVRDYALQDIEMQCQNYQPESYKVDKMADKQIENILKSSDFGIYKHEFIDRIQMLSKGNPRLAIMAAQVAVEKVSIIELINVTELYESYFKASVSPYVFKNNDLLKILGIVSFFYSVNKEDSDFCKGVCQHFNIDYHVFLEGLLRLEQLEILQTSNDFRIVYISEQVMGTYFFYKAFFDRGLLDFSVIMKYYFEKYIHRISDTVIATTNTFGYENILSKIEPSLNEYWSCAKGNENKAFGFLNIFWLYKIDETLCFVDEHITRLVLTEEEETELSESQPDKYLALLGKLCSHPFAQLRDAIEMGFFYIKRKPKFYLEFCKLLTNVFVFRREDEISDFDRQKTFIEYFSDAGYSDKVLTDIFYDVMPAMMKTNFRYSVHGWRRNSITANNYSLPLVNPIKYFREKVWLFVLNNTDPGSGKIENFIYNYLHGNILWTKEILELDVPYVKELIRKYFYNTRFVHCFLTQQLLSHFDRLEIKDEELLLLEPTFRSKAYVAYTNLNPGLLGGKPEHEHEMNPNEFRIHKDLEIRRNFVYKSMTEFKLFYESFLVMHKWEMRRGINLNGSLDVVLDKNIKLNPSLGFSMLEYVVVCNNPTDYRPGIVLKQLRSDKALFFQLYAIVITNSFPEKFNWLIDWFQYLDPGEINIDVVGKLLNIFKATDKDLSIDLFQYEKFREIDKFFLEKAIEIIVLRNKEQKVRLWLDNSSFKFYIQNLQTNLALLKAVYFDQYKMHEHFDRNFNHFLEIAKLDSNFIIEYLEFVSTNGGLYVRNLSAIDIIWQLENAEESIQKTFDFICEHDPLINGNIFCNYFFSKPARIDREICLKFLNRYLNNNLRHSKKVSIVFYCVRKSFFDKLEEFLLMFLEKENSIEIFKQIDWTDPSYVGIDNTWNDARAMEHERILNILEKMKKRSYRFSQHKEYIKVQINNYRKSAMRERNGAGISGRRSM